MSNTKLHARIQIEMWLTDTDGLFYIVSCPPETSNAWASGFQQDDPRNLFELGIREICAHFTRETGIEDSSDAIIDAALHIWRRQMDQKERQQEVPEARRDG